MLTFNLRNIATLFVVGLIIGFCIPFLFRGCIKPDGGTSIPAIKPKELKKQADQNETVYQEKIAVLEKKNQQLESELKTIKEGLGKARQKTTQRENAIKKIIEPKGYSAKELLSKARQAPIPIDSSLYPCDSLAVEVGEYIQENHVKDSLYETQIERLDSVVSIKDSIIENHKQVYASLDQLFDKAIEGQQLLMQQNKLLKKQARKRRFGSTLKTIGIMIATGVATHYLTGK